MSARRYSASGRAESNRKEKGKSEKSQVKTTAFTCAFSLFPFSFFLTPFRPHAHNPNGWFFRAEGGELLVQSSKRAAGDAPLQASRPVKIAPALKRFHA
jgi:hypothetical protein